MIVLANSYSHYQSGMDLARKACAPASGNRPSSPERDTLPASQPTANLTRPQPALPQVVQLPLILGILPSSSADMPANQEYKNRAGGWIPDEAHSLRPQSPFHSGGIYRAYTSRTQPSNQHVITRDLDCGIPMCYSLPLWAIWSVLLGDPPNHVVSWSKSVT